MVRSGDRLPGAAKEWAKLAEDDDACSQWWDANVNPEALVYNFIGKDNIPFHTIIWPGMLIGYNIYETR